MKKMYLVLIAVVMAVGFSAFTPIQKAASGNYKYDRGSGLLDVPPEIEVEDFCPPGVENPCTIEIDFVDRDIYLNGVRHMWDD